VTQPCDGQFTLPDHEYAPAKSLQLAFVRSVTSPITGELGSPERDVGFGKSGPSASPVLMPEAAVHEYNGTVPWQHDIWLSRQRSDVGPEP
jgi:hypothetical protein